MFCPGCGAPLALRPEAEARPLDAPVSLDRRSRAAPPGDADPTLSDLTRPIPPPASLTPAPAPAPAPDLERSHWDLGAVLAAPPGPALDRAPLPTPPPRHDRTLELAAPGPVPDHGPFTIGGARAGGGDDLPDVEVDALEIHLRRPPTWRRAAAWVVDGLPFLFLFAWGLGSLRGEGIVGGVAALLRAVELAEGTVTLALPLLAAVALAGFVYHFLAHLLAGATLGKWLLRLRVVGPDGRPPTLGRSAARAALALVSVATLGLGLILALFTRSGRALHDLVASTWVVEPP